MGDQAELQGKTRSEFMLEAACEKAQNVLLDQTTFVLDTRRFRRSLEHEIAHTALDHEERVMHRDCPILQMQTRSGDPLEQDAD
jgi:Protein of unknown function (DUF1778)